MDESELLYNLSYILFCMLLIYPPEEFRRIGLTLEQLFERFLGDEKVDFIGYHQRRTSLNLFVHSCLPAAYFLIHQIKFSVNDKSNYTNLDPDFPMPQEAVAFKTITWKVAQRFSLMAVLAIPVLIANWYQQKWQHHPISQTLIKFSETPNSYDAILSDINTEYRRPNIYRKKLNSITAVVATENWIIKTSLYNVNFAQQSEASLSVAKAETFNVSQDPYELQMVSIVVNPNHQNVGNFHIRINALDFRNLEQIIRCPITIPANIQFHRNVIDRFIDAFRQQVTLNPTYKIDFEVDKCYACMSVTSNIKIVKRCLDVDSRGRPLSSNECCIQCNCRPMWCVDCIARWFASRQSSSDRDRWLAQKCTCPMCRSKFCVYDVSYLERENETSNESANLAS